MKFADLFHDEVKQFATVANGHKIELVEKHPSAKLRRVVLLDVFEGDFCLLTDSPHSKIKLFRPEKKDLHCRCDYALFLERDSLRFVWLIDLKSSDRDAKRAEIGLAMTESLMRCCIAQSKQSDYVFKQAIIYPKKRDLRSSIPRQSSFNKVKAASGVYHLTVEVNDFGKAELPIRKLCE